MKLKSMISFLATMVLTLTMEAQTLLASSSVREQQEANQALAVLELGYLEIYGESVEFDVASRYVKMYIDDTMFQMHYAADLEDALNMVIGVVKTSNELWNSLANSERYLIYSA